MNEENKRSITDYIASQRERSVADEDIKKALTDAGWSEGLISAGFTEVGTDTASQDPTDLNGGDAHKDGSNAIKYIIVAVIAVLVIGGASAGAYFAMMTLSDDERIAKEEIEEGGAEDMKEDVVDTEEEEDVPYEEEKTVQDLNRDEKMVIERSDDFKRLDFTISDILEVNSKVGNWEVVSVSSFSEGISGGGISGPQVGEITRSDFKVRFEGEETLKGVMFRMGPESEAYLSYIDTVCFDPDDESQGLLPRLDSDRTRKDFCFYNQEQAKEYIGLGEELVAEVVISSYMYFRYPTGGIPYEADLESVVAIYPNWEEM